MLIFVINNEYRFIFLKEKKMHKLIDNLETPVILEWTTTNVIAPEFATAMATLWPLARAAYTPVEMNFLKAFPEVVGAESYFKPFESLFNNGVKTVNWHAAQKIMESALERHFVFDPAKFSEQMIAMFANDSCVLVTVKDQQTKETLGFITFLMRASYPTGNVKVMSFAVDPTHQKRGLGKLLMSSIFNIAPETTRIFLSTRVTNKTALNAYKSWGFVGDNAPILDHAFNLEHWSFMEYQTNQSILLQSFAQEFLK